MPPNTLNEKIGTNEKINTCNDTCKKSTPTFHFVNLLEFFPNLGISDDTTTSDKGTKLWDEMKPNITILADEMKPII
ncbi:hypothetical protein RirG_022830 [Rhizophagus irregularis DAOM 197198w]|uniref:Uncharacterized protein n=1 Tax=Rhizophagus irregularis (strain DAOM 197198w) TaxID=1432141 RepID=A0A015KD77_RHIIW|nr:hypothetical protein RirG_022830 [Rhizophagus irregularis DAOM 197198w]